MLHYHANLLTMATKIPENCERKQLRLFQGETKGGAQNHNKYSHFHHLIWRRGG